MGLRQDVQEPGHEVRASMLHALACMDADQHGRKTQEELNGVVHKTKKQLLKILSPKQCRRHMDKMIGEGTPNAIKRRQQNQTKQQSLYSPLRIQRGRTRTLNGVQQYEYETSVPAFQLSTKKRNRKPETMPRPSRNVLRKLM
jgi:hypothetical protein